MVLVLYGKMMSGTTVRKGPNLICLHGIFFFSYLHVTYTFCSSFQLCLFVLLM